MQTALTLMASAGDDKADAALPPVSTSVPESPAIDADAPEESPAAGDPPDDGLVAWRYLFDPRSARLPGGPGIVVGGGTEALASFLGDLFASPLERADKKAREAADLFRRAGDDATADKIIMAITPPNPRGCRPKWTSEEKARATLDILDQLDRNPRLTASSACNSVAEMESWKRQGVSSEALRHLWRELCLRSSLSSPAAEAEFRRLMAKGDT